MAYNYPFPQPAVPGYFNANYMPPQPQMMQMTQQVPPQNSGAQSNVSWIYVNGVQGARDHIVQPGQTAWMMDNNDPVIHVKAVDSMGTATLKSFRLLEIDPQAQTQAAPAPQIDVSQFATKDEIKAVSDKLSQLENALEGSTCEQPSHRHDGQTGQRPDAGDADAAAVPAVSADVVAAIRPAEDQRDAAKRPDQRPAA